MWWSLVACFSDPLASVGLEPVKAEPPPPEPAPLEIPAAPPMDGEKVTGEATAPEPASAGGAPPAGPPKEFNPVSIPQGPRQEGGVKWEGVVHRGANASRTSPVPANDQEHLIE